jgi:hypothetical protein
MIMRKLTRKKSTRQAKAFTLGRASFERISAVEGIRYSADLKKTFRQLDRKGVSPAERRNAIASKYGGSS